MAGNDKESGVIMDKMMKKNILNIVGASAALLFIIIFAIGLFGGWKYMTESDKVKEYFQKDDWVRFNNENFYEEQLSLREREFFYSIIQNNSGYEADGSAYGHYKYNSFSNTISLETEQNKADIKIIDCGDFHMLMEYEGKLIDFIPGEVQCNLFSYAPFGEKAVEVIKDYTALYDIKSIDEEKIIFTVPGYHYEYSNMEDELNKADNITYEKLILTGYKLNDEGNVENLQKDQIVHTHLTEEEALKEVQADKVYEFLWYNEELEVEKVVFCSVQIDEMSDEERLLRDKLGAVEWIRQEYSNGRVKDSSVVFGISCKYIEQGYEKYIQYAVDYDNMQIIFESDSDDENIVCDIIRCNGENLILKYNDKVYSFMSKEICDKSVYFVDSNGEYFEGSIGKYRATDVDMEKLSKNAVFEELNVSNTNEVVTHRELNKEEAVEKLAINDSFVYIWCDEDLNITKILFYNKEQSFMDNIVSKEWYILSEVVGGDIEVMVFEKDLSFDYYSTIDMYVGKLCDYTYYEVMDDNQIKLTGGIQENYIKIIECNGEELTIEFEGKIRTYVSNQMVVYEQMYEGY